MGYRVGEAADMIGADPATVYRAIRQNQLDAVIVRPGPGMAGRPHWEIDADALRRYRLARLRETQGSKVARLEAQVKRLQQAVTELQARVDYMTRQRRAS